MDIEQLQYFKEVAKFQNMTKAANAVSITQPALSRSIQALEHELGYSLFKRENHRIFLNQYGEVFLKYVNLILQELTSAKKDLCDLNNSREETLYLSVTVPEIYMNLLEAYLNEYPDVHIHQPIDSGLSQEELLLEQKVDYCISSKPIIHSEIQFTTLLQEECYLMVRKDHPLAQRKSVTIKDFAEEHFIVTSAGTELRDLTDNFFSRASVHPNIAYEVPETAMLRRMVDLGAGVTLYPASMWIQGPRGEKKYGELNLTVLKIKEPTCRRSINIYYLENSYKSLAAKRFFPFVQEFFLKLYREIL